jgi:hypothetical protein
LTGSADFASTTGTAGNRVGDMKMDRRQVKKRFWISLPLLTLAPMGYFLAPYLEGLGVLPPGYGFILGAFSMFIVLGMASIAFAFIQKAKPIVRVLIFVCVFIAQGIFIFNFIPPGATSEMMGIAQRLRHEFSTDQLRDCAKQLQQRLHAGTLKVQTRAKDDDFTVEPSALVVDDTELPTILRGRFQRIFIQTNSLLGIEQVVFALGDERGIFCDNRKNVHEFFVCSMADGVHAYRYQRM